MPEDDRGDARQRKAHQLVAGTLEADLVPDRGVAHPEVRIAREDGPARRRLRAAQCPAVRPDARAGSGKDRAQSGDARVERAGGEQRCDLRPRTLVDDGRGAARRVGHERCERARTQAEGDVRAQQLLRLVPRGVEDLELADEDRVRRRPAFGAVPEEDELDRESIAVLLEELVHPVGERL